MSDELDDVTRAELEALLRRALDDEWRVARARVRAADAAVVLARVRVQREALGVGIGYWEPAAVADALEEVESLARDVGGSD